MKQHSDTIIINGTHFNAQTGQPLAAGAKARQVPRNVDGILPQHIAGAVLKNPNHREPLRSTATKPIMDIARTPAKHLPKRQTQAGQTLMRRALTKPTPGLKRTTKVHTPNGSQAAVSIANVTPKTSAAVVSDRKLQHAQKITKSRLIRRFSETSIVTTSPTRPSQRTIAGQQLAASLASHTNPSLFEAALARANSHQQSTPEHVEKALRKGSKQKKLVNFAASSVAVLLLAGFVGYQNLPAMKFQYASRQAGFRAELPDYQPSGFSIGKLSYQTGAVSVDFHSNSDSSRAFAITQKPSAWDSQTLRDNFVAIKGEGYHVTSAGGRTVYVYGNNNATWVNGGVWYTVQTNGSLSERQLTQLASSM